MDKEEYNQEREDDLEDNQEVITRNMVRRFRREKIKMIEKEIKKKNLSQF